MYALACIMRWYIFLLFLRPVYFRTRQTRNKGENKTIVHFSGVAFLFYFAFHTVCSFVCCAGRHCRVCLCTRANALHALTSAAWLAVLHVALNLNAFFAVVRGCAARGDCIIAASESSANNQFFERINARLIGFRFRFFCILRVPHWQVNIFHLRTQRLLCFITDKFWCNRNIR